jgi:DNA-binding transcriptional ArsR family regulator
MPASAAVHVIEDGDRAALALHPLRLKILAELREPDSAAGLARRLGLPRQRLNYHVRQLEAQGLVEPVGERKVRNCTERLVRAVARSYLISPATLGELAVDPASIRDRASSAYLVAVTARVIREVSEQREQARGVGKRLPTLTLQADVRFASSETQHAFANELSQEMARLIAKYHCEDEPGGRRFRVMAGSYPAPMEDAVGNDHQEEDS